MPAAVKTEDVVEAPDVAPADDDFPSFASGDEGDEATGQDNAVSGIPGPNAESQPPEPPVDPNQDDEGAPDPDEWEEDDEDYIPEANDPPQPTPTFPLRNRQWYVQDGRSLESLSYSELRRVRVVLELSLIHI